MKFKLQIAVVLLLTLLFLNACSTENNTFINRAYHGTTARYNGYFNANELLRLGIKSYRDGLQEDYYQVLPLDPLPSEKEVLNLYPAIDTAIAKCTKVIQNHSMPSNDKPSKKKEEHNPWIDENWQTIGRAAYYRRDYEGALKNFRFIKKFYANDPTLFIAEMWIAKTNIELERYNDAYFNLELIDKAIEEEQIRKEENKGIAKKIEKFKNRKNEEKIASVPKNMYFELFKTKAELALRRDSIDIAINHLTEALNYAKKQENKARVSFILAQLLEQQNRREEAKTHYSKVLRYNTKYDMIFAARIHRAMMGGNEKLKKELFKMMRDPKNAEYRDQLYYALAQIELRKNNRFQGKVYLTQSAFYSTSNNRQKGMAYELLGNLSFEEKNYVSAQKYYDSCVAAIDLETYPNGELIQTKAIKLADLVKAVDLASFEDSVQRIAKMNEKDRIAFIEGVIKQIKEQEELRKKMEAKRLLELQKNMAVQQNAGGAGKWYWNNPKMVADGYDEFRRIWGTDRVNEDDWRRREKIVLAQFTDENGDTIQSLDEEITKEPIDTLTVEHLLTFIPLNDSLFDLSQQRMVESLYDAGLIYKNQLQENQLAEEQFLKVKKQTFENDFTLLSSYQLYEIYKDNEVSKAGSEKNFIFNNYPNSDYANYLRDPDYFIKKKENDALALKEYLKFVDRYAEEMYDTVLIQANQVINNEPDNKFRSKYMLLKAMVLGQQLEDKQLLKPILNQLIKEYKETEEAERSAELLSILEHGVSENKLVDFTKKSIYTYADNLPFYILVFLTDDMNTNSSKSKISDFNRTFFSRNRLNITSKVYGRGQNVVFISVFEDEKSAKDYINTFKADKRKVDDLRDATIIFITKENLRVLFETQKLAEYEDFLLENY